MIEDLQPKPQFRTDSLVREIPSQILAYGLQHMTLVAECTLRSMEHASRLAHAKSHSEVTKLSNDHYQAQTNILNCHARCTTDFVYEMARQTVEPFKVKATLPCVVIL